MQSPDGPDRTILPAPTRMLVVEDVAAVGEILKTHLEAAPGATVVELVGSLRAAVGRIRDTAFDLIVADLDLPDSKGLETLDRLMEATDRPIIVLAIEDGPQLREAAIARGAWDFLRKNQLNQAYFDQMVRLITLQANAYRALRESEARFRSLASLGADWYFETDDESRFSRFDGKLPEQNSAAFKKYFGKAAWEVGLVCESGWDDQRRLHEAHLPFREFIHYWALRDGTRRYFSVSADPVFDATGRFTGYRGVGRDITAQKVAEQLVEHRATHDSLTGLPNRAIFSALLAQMLRSAQRHKQNLAVLFIDLDGFKAVNDRLGHDAGDTLLKEMAARFRGAVRTSDVVVRLGGDEFVVLAQDLVARESAAVVAQKLLDAAAMPVQVVGGVCQVGASIGIATFPDDGDGEQLLIRYADHAMYVAKREGKNTFRFFTPTPPGDIVADA